MWKSEKYKSYCCQCLIVECLRRIVSGLITSKNKTNEYRDFSCVWFAPQCIIFPIYNQGSQSRLSRKEKMMADAQVVYFAYAGSDVLGSKVLPWGVRSPRELSSDAMSRLTRAKKTGGGKGLIYGTWSAAFSWRRSSVPNRKGKQKKTVHRFKRRKHKIKLY